MKILLKIIAILSISLSQYALSYTKNCDGFYFKGIKPSIVHSKLSKGTTIICNEFFSVEHSSITKTGVWSAEKITKESVFEASKIDRKDSFHEESRLKSSERASLKDYVRSGYDRGHIAPSADMPTKKAQHESFALSNMIPQDPQNNRVLWSGIESTTRNLAVQSGEIYVVTGAVFTGKYLKRLNGNVFVPSHVFKAIYIEKTKKAAAYIAPNDSSMEYKVISINELETLTGIDVFPALSEKQKNDPAKLGRPLKYKY